MGQTVRKALPNGVAPCVLLGRSWKGFRDQWRAAVADAGFPDLLVHDLRRSAVSNMIQEFGIEEDEAMLISGHKTRDMLTRYNIRRPGKTEKIGAAMELGFQKLKSKSNQEEKNK